MITKISASRTDDFVQCTLLYYYAVELGLVPDVDSDVQRIGTNWHGMHDVVGNETNYNKVLEIIVEHLDEFYSHVPDTRTAEEWNIERNILLYSFIAYFLRFRDDPVEVLATEIAFEVPMRNPTTGRALPNVVRRGKIDRILRYHNKLYIGEHKSTGKSVDAESSYFDNLRLAIQPSLYYDVAVELQTTGQLKQYGISADDPLISGILYDVWHKPGIKPAKLTQANTALFLESHEYYNTQFSVVNGNSSCMVEGVSVELEPGKKIGTFTMKETPDMYGVRLLTDILQERPNFYFARREVPRTERDMVRFRHQLYSVYKNILAMRRSGHWYGNPSHCEATYKCAYCPVCYGQVDITQEKIPGFKFINKEK